MTWLKKDDRFPEHRKIRRLSDGAYRLHDTALCACAKDETDGRVTEADITEMHHGDRLRKYVPMLVEAGLWEVVQGGWVIHDYLDYNPSHQQLEDERAASRERQARRRRKMLGLDTDETASQSDVSRRDSRVSHGPVTRESRDPDPTRPDPTRPDPSLATDVASAGGPRKRGTRLPTDFIPSEKSRHTIRAEHPHIDLAQEHNKFCDYWAAQPGQRGVKVDWDATWRNWMRKAAEHQPNGKSRRQHETDELFARAMARAQAADAAEAAGHAIEGVVL